MQNFVGWVNGLAEKNQYKNCTRILPQMAQVQSVKGVVHIDGPFTESKEILSGVFLIEARDFDDALAIAQTCPMLLKGEKITVLEVNNS